MKREDDWVFKEENDDFQLWFQEQLKIKNQYSWMW